MCMLAVLGDTHIPGRANNIPSAFIKEIKKANPEKIIFTGDATELSTIRQLEEIAPVVKVMGNMDRIPALEMETVTWGVPILVVHGHQISPRGNHEKLEDLAVSKRCKMVVTGHTHVPELWQGPRAIVLNPGSATGAWPGIGESAPPSMALVDTNQRLLQITILQLIKSEGIVEKKTHMIDLTARA